MWTLAEYHGVKGYKFQNHCPGHLENHNKGTTIEENPSYKAQTGRKMSWKKQTCTWKAFGAQWRYNEKTWTRLGVIGGGFYTLHLLYTNSAIHAQLHTIGVADLSGRVLLYSKYAARKGSIQPSEKYYLVWLCHLGASYFKVGSTVPVSEELCDVYV